MQLGVKVEAINRMEIIQQIKVRLEALIKLSLRNCAEFEEKTELHKVHRNVNCINIYQFYTCYP